MKMVRIIGYQEIKSEQGKVFFSLKVQGGIEMVRSKTTGHMYATARKASIVSTFDEETCRALVGTELPGSIKKEVCEPYEYVIPETGEVIELNHTYVYEEDEPNGILKSEVEAKPQIFSSNGHGVLQGA